MCVCLVPPAHQASVSEGHSVTRAAVTHQSLSGSLSRRRASSRLAAPGSRAASWVRAGCSTGSLPAAFSHRR